MTPQEAARAFRKAERRANMRQETALEWIDQLFELADEMASAIEGNKLPTSAEPVSAIITSGITAQALAQHIIECGAPFSYEPYPDDEHRFTVKREWSGVLPKVRG